MSEYETDRLSRRIDKLSSLLEQHSKSIAEMKKMLEKIYEFNGITTKEGGDRL